MSESEQHDRPDTDDIEFPEEGDVEAANIEPEPVPDDEFMPGEEADENDEIDDKEQEEQPHTDLPEGTRTEDYGDD